MYGGSNRCVEESTSIPEGEKQVSRETKGEKRKSFSTYEPRRRRFVSLEKDIALRKCM